jgi:hypothetical protein
LKGGSSSVKVPVRDGEDSSSRRKQPDKDNNVCYLQKSLLGGILLFEILLCEPFFHSKLHALERSRLQSKSSSNVLSQVCGTPSVIMQIVFSYKSSSSENLYFPERSAVMLTPDQHPKSGASHWSSLCPLRFWQNLGCFLL